MIRIYDRTMRGSNQRRYYDYSGYYNFGYWGDGAKSQREACDALVDQLVGRISNHSGKILDVACGLGATTQRLMNTYKANDITGINISEKQIDEARTRAVGCTFQIMNASDLDFPDNYFDAVICVEAAFHFDTRDKFLREAFRVLKPEGSLVLSDILFRKISNFLSDASQVPPANLVANVDEYTRRLAAVGFNAVHVTDATEECLGGFQNNLRVWARNRYRAGQMKFSRSLGASAVSRLVARYFGLVCKNYLMVSAQKPSYSSSDK